MKRASFFFAAASLLFAACQPGGGGGGTNGGDLEALQPALKEAKASGKLVLLKFQADW